MRNLVNPPIWAESLVTLYGVVKSTILEQKIQAVTVLMGESAHFSTSLNLQSLLKSPILSEQALVCLRN